MIFVRKMEIDFLKGKYALVNLEFRIYLHDIMKTYSNYSVAIKLGIHIACTTDGI